MALFWPSGNIEEAGLVKLKELTRQSSERQWFKTLGDFKNFETFRDYAFVCNDETNVNGFPSRRWTVLHHMAYLKAPKKVVKKFRKMGFYMGLTDFEGRKAIDYIDTNDESYRKLYEPHYNIKVDVAIVEKLEENFHKLIRERASSMIAKNKLVLPQLMSYLEKDAKVEIFFAVPDMYGGFRTHFTFSSSNSNEIECLESHSFCRVFGGSGQLHKIYTDRIELVWNEYDDM